MILYIYNVYNAISHIYLVIDKKTSHAYYVKYHTFEKKSNIHFISDKDTILMFYVWPRDYSNKVD